MLKIRFLGQQLPPPPLRKCSFKLNQSLLPPPPLKMLLNQQPYVFSSEVAPPSMTEMLKIRFLGQQLPPLGSSEMLATGELLASCGFFTHRINVEVGEVYLIRKKAVSSQPVSTRFPPESAGVFSSEMAPPCMTVYDVGELLDLCTLFTHVLNVEPGEDVMSKIIAFCEQEPGHAVCIISANGKLSEVTLGQIPRNYGKITHKPIEGKPEPERATLCAKQ